MEMLYLYIGLIGFVLLFVLCKYNKKIIEKISPYAADRRNYYYVNNTMTYPYYSGIRSTRNMSYDLRGDIYPLTYFDPYWSKTTNPRYYYNIL